MSEFFLELFSEEIPSNLQKNARFILLENFRKLFQEKNINFKKSNSYSTPNRLIVLFEGLEKEINQKSEEIRGPKVGAIEKALGKTAIKELLPLQPGDVPDTYANVDDLVKQFKYKPATTVQDGIHRFVDWYRNYYKV